MVPKDASTFRHVPEETEEQHSRLFTRGSSKGQSEYRTENLASKLRFSVSHTLHTPPNIVISKENSLNFILGKELATILMKQRALELELCL
jgi:hypothetical protein